MDKMLTTMKEGHEADARLCIALWGQGCWRIYKAKLILRGFQKEKRDAEAELNKPKEIVSKVSEFISSNFVDDKLLKETYKSVVDEFTDKELK